MLKLLHIDKYYQIRKNLKQEVLCNLNLALPDRGFVSVLGKSGAGKTTLLNIIGGLDSPDSGSIYLNNTEIIDYDSFRRDKVGFVFQEYNLINHMSVSDNIMLSISEEMKNKKNNVEQILSNLGISDLNHKLAGTLSGGQKQRVAIARVIAKDVNIIICDEPTGSLDKKNTMNTIKILKELSLTKLVIFVTHNNEIAEQYSDRIIHLGEGNIRNEFENDSNCVNCVEANEEEGNSKIIYNNKFKWIAVKNLLGKKKKTIENILLIAVIMFITTMSIVLKSNLFSNYVHEYYINHGIKNVIVDINEGSDKERILKELQSHEDIMHATYEYNSIIRVAATNYEETNKIEPVNSYVLLEDITSNEYISQILTNGRMPENTDEVLMTAKGAIKLLRDLDIGGQRLMDQYETGRIDNDYVYSIIDDKKFIIVEYGYPRMKIVGLIDDRKIHEEQHKLYFSEGFTELFEYPKGLQYNAINLYKNSLDKDAYDLIVKYIESNNDISVNKIDDNNISRIYNKIDSFLELSTISLYLILIIASISYMSFLTASLNDRKYEIGLYRSIGYSKKNISAILGFEMVITGMISLLIVCGFAAGAIYLLTDGIINQDFNVSSLSQSNVMAIIIALSVALLFFSTLIVYKSNKDIMSKTIRSNIYG